MSSMGNAPDRLSFPETEEEVLELWKRLDAFRTSMEVCCANAFQAYVPMAEWDCEQGALQGNKNKRGDCREVYRLHHDAYIITWKFELCVQLTEGKPEYSFYDGPPFATGLPHYGHILAGTIKDTVTRYAAQTGHYVSRRFGWDCHGLPVEFEIDKTLGIQSRDDVMEMGIAAYNKECRSIVQRYSSEWESIVTRLGRWIDFRKDYKTMEPWYMESVWWVFKSLWERGLVYRGFKVMPYSTACTTPLSNFEANQNYHDDTVDPSIVVRLPLREDPSVSLVIWTTTPWTLPSNVAVCVHPEMKYVKIEDKKSGRHYILAESRLCQLYPKMNKKGYKGGEFEILESFAGSSLEGKYYEPLFPYYWDTYKDTAWRVLCDTYVTDDAGTGVVHQAPAFGEDDYRVCLKNSVVAKNEELPCPVDPSGRFTDPVHDFKGQYVKDADKAICDLLKAQGKLLQKDTITHSYPFCWRSDTPLIYRAVPSWFVKVEDIKDKLLANNEKTYWVPNFVKEKRFHNWLKDARDWAVSRNRYWGTPLPIWASEDFSEVVVVGSIQELEELTGEKITDIHREFIDHLTIPSKHGNAPLRRVEEVFDCWFESGSMPYAQIHYPFENKERFDREYFPADFIAEGLDQTRGWFYTLMVLSTALFDKPAFKNLIVNGLVLAADGKKMSKRLQNYPDPVLILNRYGADALRMYLINSPVVRAEPLRFKEAGVNSVLREVMLPWYNAFRFFLQNAKKLETDVGKAFEPDPLRAYHSQNAMDHWIIASTQGLIKYVRDEMGAYRLYTVVPRLVQFIEELTNWYIRLNRSRLKGMESQEGAATALAVLYEVLMNLCRLMAPFTPFFTEFLYQKLRLVHPKRNDEGASLSEVGRAESVHYLMIPDYDPNYLDDEVEASVSAMQSVVNLGRTARERKGISLKNPIADVIVISSDDKFLKRVQQLESYISEELNFLDLQTTTAETEWCNLQLKCNPQVLGKRLGKEFGPVRKVIENMSNEEVAKWLQNNEGVLNVEASGKQYGIESSALTVQREFKGGSDKYEAAVSPDGSHLVVINAEQNEQLKRGGYAREIIARMQKLRKRVGLDVSDNVDAYISVFKKTASTLRQNVEDLKERAHQVADLPQGGGIAAQEHSAEPQNFIQDDDYLAHAKTMVCTAIGEHVEKFRSLVRSDLLVECSESMPEETVKLGTDETIIGDALVRLTIAKPIARFAANEQLKAVFGDSEGAEGATSAAAQVSLEPVDEMKKAVRLHHPNEIIKMADADGKFSLTVNRHTCTLQIGRHVFLDGVKHMLGCPWVQEAWSRCDFAEMVAHYQK